MPQIKLLYHIDEGEKVNIYFNDVLLDSNCDSFYTEEKFKLIIEQYRVYTEKYSALKDISYFLITPIIENNRFKNMKERESPFYFYYESECEVLSDSEIITRQFKKGFHSIFDVTSKSAVFTDVISEERTNRSTYKNWIISRVFFLVILSSIPLYMMVRIIYETLVYNNLPMLLVGFIVGFCFIFVGIIWYNAFSSISPKKMDKYDVIGMKNNAIKYYRISSFLWVLLGISSYFVYFSNAEFSSVIPCVGGVAVYIVKGMIFEHFSDSSFNWETNSRNKVRDNLWKGIEFISVILFILLNLVFQSCFLD
ncbi:MAG: hypothetical protein V1920_00775 [Bacillota bacterium]